MTIEIVVYMKGKPATPFYRTYSNFSDAHFAIHENGFIKVDGKYDYKNILIPKSNIDFIGIREFEHEGQ